MKRIPGILSLLWLAACSGQGSDGAGASADDAAVPEKPVKLGLCVACHGEDGRSRMAAAPHLAGQNPLYLVWALNQYKAGAREGGVMGGVIGALNDADIEALARWYSAQPCAGAAGP